MNQCPNCHRAIDIQPSNHGSLFTCPHCGAVYFIDWDGNPETPSKEVTQKRDVEASSEGNGVEFIQPENNIFQPVDTVTESFHPIAEPPQPVPEGPGVFSFQDMVNETLAPPMEAPSEGNIEGDVLVPNPSLSNLDDVTMDQPSVLYDLTISGLDVKSIWEPVRDVLSEARLKLDLQAIELNLRNGKVILEKQSPLVVFYIVQKIKSLNIHIEWKVHAGS